MGNQWTGLNAEIKRNEGGAAGGGVAARLVRWRATKALRSRHEAEGGWGERLVGRRRGAEQGPRRAKERSCRCGARGNTPGGATSLISHHYSARQTCQAKQDKIYAVNIILGGQAGLL